MTCCRYVVRLFALCMVGVLLALHAVGETMQVKHSYGQVRSATRFGPSFSLAAA